MKKVQSYLEENGQADDREAAGDGLEEAREDGEG